MQPPSEMVSAAGAAGFHSARRGAMQPKFMPAASRNCVGSAAHGSTAQADNMPKGGAKNAGVENAGAITHGKLPEKKTIRYQYSVS